ncbi:MAG: hypothetical protein ACE5GU_02360 [Candidatus Scalinduaceae bacterium]
MKAYFIVTIICFAVYPTTVTHGKERISNNNKDVQVSMSLVREYLELNEAKKENEVINWIEEIGYSPKELKIHLKDSFPFPEKETGIYRKLVSFDNKKGEYIVYIPKGYDPKKTWPLIMSLHGVGESGLAYIRLWLSYSKHDNKYIFICPYYASGYWWEEDANNLIINALRRACIDYNVDTNRVYLTGFSSRAHGVWYFSIRHPDLLAGIVTISGECPIPDQISNLMNVPVYIIHGIKDSVIPVAAARDAKDRLEALGYEYRYEELPNLKHRYPISRNNAILEWLDKKQRNPRPRKVKYKNSKPNPQRIYWSKIEKAVNIAGPPDVKIDKKLFDYHTGLKLEKSGFKPDYAILNTEINDNKINVTCENIEKFKLFLDGELVDMGESVVVMVNGKQMFSGKLKQDIDVLFQTLEVMYDRNSLYTGSVEVEIKR